MPCSAPNDLSSRVSSNADSASNDEAALIARLQSQFGDINVSSFLEGSNHQSNDDGCGNDGDDSESSLEEPSPEELRAWQEAQFQKGRMHLEAKKIIDKSNEENTHKSALQRRREKKTTFQRTLIREFEASEEAEEWEHVSSMPDLDEDSIFFPTAIDKDALQLAGGVHPLLKKIVEEGDPDVLGTKWTKLYSSSEGDGLSFRNLWDKLRGYDGPTMMLFGGIPSSSRCIGGKCDNETIRVSLGFFTTDSWIESPNFFGSSDDCFLFGLDYNKNDVSFFRPKSRATKHPTQGMVPTVPKQTKNHMYCHPSNLSRANGRRQQTPGRTNGSVHGIGVGGTPSQPRLHITESLEECRALTYDNIFEDGDILLGRGDDSLYYFDTDSIEIWGVGGEEWIAGALKAQAKEREVHQASLEQARKVDKRQFLEDFENGIAWRSGNKPGLFGHRDLVEERDI